MDGELDGWARERVPDLIARAEAEAVAVLRDALLRAALPSEPAAPQPKPQPAAKAGRAQMGRDLLWAYCILAADDSTPEDLPGVDPGARVERVENAGLVALVSRVPHSEFAEEPLRTNLNDLGWLERVARSHEAVLDEALARTTVVPLRLCTLFSDTDAVAAMLEHERAALMEALDAVRGRQEWGVKLLADPERVLEEVSALNPDAAALRTELEGRDDGSAYMRRRRLDRQMRELADQLVAGIVEDVRHRLEECVLELVTRPPQNRELSRHQGEMLLNAACLVPVDEVGRLQQIVDELQAEYANAGAWLELSGPWPPYNFVPTSTTPTLI